MNIMKTNMLSIDSKIKKEETGIPAVVSRITAAGHYILKKTPELKPYARINKWDAREVKLKAGDPVTVRFKNSHTFDNGNIINCYEIVK